LKHLCSTSPCSAIGTIVCARLKRLLLRVARCRADCGLGDGGGGLVSDQADDDSHQHGRLVGVVVPQADGAKPARARAGSCRQALQLGTAALSVGGLARPNGRLHLQTRVRRRDTRPVVGGDRGPGGQSLSVLGAAANPSLCGWARRMTRPTIHDMPGWTKVAVLVCLICASGCANEDESESTKRPVIPVGGFREAPKESCFSSANGVLRWCLQTDDVRGTLWPCSRFIHVTKSVNGSQWFIESEEGYQYGYLRRAGRGRWRAMVPVRNHWVARDRTIVRASNGRWIISLRGRTIGFASGAYPVAVGAYRLLAGSC
jgi:hypothetical protein